LSSTQSIDLNYLEMLVLEITIQSNNNGQRPQKQPEQLPK
jgi:hypothetical protein